LPAQKVSRDGRHKTIASPDCPYSQRDCKAEWASMAWINSGACMHEAVVSASPRLKLYRAYTCDDARRRA